MESITVKFGGSSLADAGQFRKVAQIVGSDPARRFVIVSAPGKRFAGDVKVTDLLYAAWEKAQEPEFDGIMEQIRARFTGIMDELQLKLELGFDEIARALRSGAGRDYAASRGEYLNAQLMAAYLGMPFVDAAECICFRADGSFDAETTNERLRAVLSEADNAVLPGFYGALPDGTVHTFSRGGSDITGALVARAVGSKCYENWTDVSGILVTDPRIVPDAQPIDCVTYTELRELAYMGASVMHEDAIFPVRAAGIPINIRNTNAPEAPGTMILSDSAELASPPITGIAGKRDFSIIQLEKDQMNETPGFLARVLEIFARHGISVEHLPTGIDSMSVVAPTAQLHDCRAELLAQLRASVQPDVIQVETDLAMIAVVGRGMIRRKGMAARVFAALAEANINIRMIDQGSSELNIIIGVNGQDYEPAVQALYHAFF